MSNGTEGQESNSPLEQVDELARTIRCQSYDVAKLVETKVAAIIGLETSKGADMAENVGESLVEKLTDSLKTTARNLVAINTSVQRL